MTSPRPEVIDILVERARTAMVSHPAPVTLNEYFCACFTLALHAVIIGLENGADVNALREGVAQIYAAFPAEKVN